MDLTINTTQISLSGAASDSKTQTVEKTSVQEISEVSAEQTTAQSVSSRNYDTVDLSEQAIEYLNSSEEDSTSDTASVSAAAETASDSDSVDALYTYTDDELAELLREGAISQVEYNNEMAKRSGE